jgi:hypothetical protein
LDKEFSSACSSISSQRSVCSYKCALDARAQLSCNLLAIAQTKASKQWTAAVSHSIVSKISENKAGDIAASFLKRPERVSSLTSRKAAQSIVS